MITSYEIHPYLHLLSLLAFLVERCSHCVAVAAESEYVPVVLEESLACCAASFHFELSMSIGNEREVTLVSCSSFRHIVFDSSCRSLVQADQLGKGPSVLTNG